jgi:hypothetical protein
MQIDTYTKLVLTVIAAALVWLCVRDLLPMAHAQARLQGQPVTLVDASINARTPLPVMIVGVKRHSWTMNADLGRPYQDSLPWEPLAVTSGSAETSAKP